MYRKQITDNGKLAKQFARYMAGGALYFWVGYAIFAICYSGLHWSWLPAKILADAIGWTLNYLVQRFWAFGDQHHLSEMQHVGRYLFIESIGFVIDYLIIWGLNSIGITPYIGFFISSAFFTVWSWLWYKYWVFPESKIVYHASPQVGLSIITPQRTLSKDKYIGDLVFATANKKLAIMYLAPKGFQIIMSPSYRKPKIFIRADQAEYQKRDTGGALYEFAAQGFGPTPQNELTDFEKVSPKSVKPVRELSFRSSLQAFRDNSIAVYFVDQQTFDELIKTKQSKQLVSRLKPYTFK